MRGAPKDIKSTKGKKPIDLVADISSATLQNELRMSLESESKCDFMMLKTPLKKTEKSLALPVTFLSFFNFIYVILIIILFPVWTNKIGRYLIYVDLSLGILSIILWLRTQFSDPGFIQKPKNVDFLKLM